MNRETNTTNIIGSVFCIERYSPVSSCICLIGQHLIHFVPKDLSSDNLFDALSTTIKQDTKQIQIYPSF